MAVLMGVQEAEQAQAVLQELVQEQEVAEQRPPAGQGVVAVVQAVAAS